MCRSKYQILVHLLIFTIGLAICLVATLLRKL